MTTTTRLVIKDVEYDLEDTFQNAGLNILVFMAKRLGVTLKTIMKGLDDIDSRSRAARFKRREWADRVVAGEDMTDEPEPPSDMDVLWDVLSDEDGLDVFRGLVWLAKTQAGVRGEGNAFLTLEEAAEGIGFGQITFKTDGDDEDEGDVPKDESLDLEPSLSTSTT